MNSKLFLFILILFLTIGCVNAAENTTEDTHINIESITVTEGLGENFTGTLYNSNNDTLIGQHVLVNLTRTSSGANKVYDVVTDYNGKFNIPIFLAKGDYTAEVKYNELTIGNTTYTSSSAGPVSITVIEEIDNRTSSFILAYGFNKYYNMDLNLTGIITDNTGNSIPGQHLSIKLSRTSNGASKTYDVVSDYEGGFVLPINLGIGSYTANITYSGTSIYAPSKRNININVKNDDEYLYP